MVKRVVAWVLIAGFILIIADILFIHKYTAVCASIYAVIAITFILFKSKVISNNNNVKDDEKE